MRLAAISLLLFTPFATALAADTNDARLHELQAAVSAERIQADIEKLVSFGTRHTLSETESESRGIGAARRWIKAEFERISADCRGCLEVRYVSDFVEGEPRIPERTEVVSVIAIQRGRSDPDRMVMMSGDIDSRVTDPLNGTSDSPGANDNASGLAGVLEAARVLSKEKFDGTIVYAALAGEEQGLFGGKILAAEALEEGWRIKAVLNNDMIGNIEGVDGLSTMPQPGSFLRARAQLKRLRRRSCAVSEAEKSIHHRATLRAILIASLTLTFQISML